MRLYALCAVTLAACAFEPSGPSDPGDDDVVPDPPIPADVDAAVVVNPPDPPPPPPDPPTLSCRIEGDNLGIVGAKVTTGSREYTFVSWDANAAGADTGFRLEGPANNLRYEVRTTSERRMGESLVYTGSERIMRVDFCLGGEEGGD